MSEEITKKGSVDLSPEVDKVIKETITEVLEEFNESNIKYFDVDVLHTLRTKITNLVHQRVGKKEVINIDIGVDLSKVEDCDFCFKINIPKDIIEDKIMEK